MSIFDSVFHFFLQKYGDPTMMRFLIARSMDPEKAAKMFVQWRKWRTSLAPSGFIPDSEVPDELQAKKIYLQGLSKKGLPIMLVKGSKHYISKDQVQFKSNLFHPFFSCFLPFFFSGLQFHVDCFFLHSCLLLSSL